MKIQWWKNIATLVMVVMIGLAPVLSCACQDSPPNAHACCPDSNQDSQENHSLDCCDFSIAKAADLEFTIEASTSGVQLPNLNFEQKLPSPNNRLVLSTLFHTINGSAPPQLYLELCSLLI